MSKPSSSGSTSASSSDNRSLREALGSFLASLAAPLLPCERGPLGVDSRLSACTASAGPCVRFVGEHVASEAARVRCGGGPIVDELPGEWAKAKTLRVVLVVVLLVLLVWLLMFDMDARLVGASAACRLVIDFVEAGRRSTSEAVVSSVAGWVGSSWFSSAWSVPFP